jgi:SAM-dependent methyltransferase
MPDKSPEIALEQRAAAGAMLFSPSAGRNKAAIAAAMIPLLPNGAHVLELGSGTGEHAEHICSLRPDLHWTPSDPDAASRASCAARAAAGNGALRPPLPIDLTRSGWWEDAPRCDVIFCANTIHISPWETAQGLAAGAAALLDPGGRTILYGPFLEGDESAPSNIAFSEDLKARDPRWGVRERGDVERLFGAHGLRPAQRIPMPANNQVLGFERIATG